MNEHQSNGAAKKPVVHVTDSRGREYVGVLVESVMNEGRRWVSLEPVYVYIVQQNGEGVNRGFVPPHLLEGSERVECMAEEVTFLRADSADWEDLRKGGEVIRAKMRAMASGITVVGSVPPGRA